MAKIEAAMDAGKAELSEIADVIIVGLGGAGASAAIAAAEAGADVVVIERTTGGGGSTAVSGGIIYLGGGTSPQVANGFSDTPNNMARYLKAAQPRANADKIDLYCQDSLAHYDWLISLGMPFNDRFYPEKHFQPMTDDTLLESGNEAAYPFPDVANPMPRGHKPGAGYAGHIVFDHLLARVNALGVRIIPDATVNALVRNESGAVVGVQYRSEGRNAVIGARKAVLLSTGGAEWNPDIAAASLLSREGVVPLGVPTADGSGIALGESVGAAVVNLDQCIVTSPFYPPESLIKGILVNVEGKRFVAEDVYHSRSSHAVLDQPGGKAYLICDNRNFGRPLLGELHAEVKHEVVGAWDNIPEMAMDLGMSADVLEKTITDYNHYAANGKDEEFHKQPKWLDPILEVPFGAIDCSVDSAYYAGLSLGGLDTDVDGQVLRPDGSAVPGLFAAGQMAPSIAIEGAAYASGLLVGTATFFGRRAGAAVARQTSRL